MMEAGKQWNDVWNVEKLQLRILNPMKIFFKIKNKDIFRQIKTGKFSAANLS